MKNLSSTVRTSDPDETRALGRRIGEGLGAGDVVLLWGDLGSGKTTLTQGICHGLGVSEWASSPTYILIAEYRGRVPIYHCDFYRIDDPGELDTLALDEVFYGAGVAVVEWPDVAHEWYPPDATRVRISVESPETRKFEIVGADVAAE